MGGGKRDADRHDGGHTHDRLGRFYILAVRPFSVFVVRASLARAAA
jgi:hypothetical protein